MLGKGGLLLAKYNIGGDYGSLFGMDARARSISVKEPRPVSGGFARRARLGFSIEPEFGMRSR